MLRSLIIVVLCVLLVVGPCYAAPRINADYVVVGGGSAGPMVAYQLSKDGTKDVVLLEQGLDVYDDYKYESPLGYDSLKRDWPDQVKAQHTIEDISFDIAPGVTISTPFRSLVVGWPEALGGGPSQIAGVFDILHEWDLVQWNSTEWTYETLVNEWKNIENFTTYSNYTPSPNYHGTDGPMKVTVFPPDSNQELMVQAIQDEFGLDYTEDTLEGNPTGIHNTPRPVTIEEGTGRAVGQDTYHSFITDEYLASHPNLKVFTSATVTKINLKENPTLHAISVDYYDDGKAMKNININTGGEVIVSAGPGSAKILMISGLGDCDELDTYNIECYKNLPQVGKSFNVNALTGMTFSTFFGVEDISKKGAIFTAFVNSSYNTGDAPDIEIATTQLNFSPNFGIHVFEMVQHSGLVPGDVRLRSDSPFDNLVMTTNIYRNWQEARPLAEIALRIRALMNTIEVFPGVPRFNEGGSLASLPSDLDTMARGIQQIVKAAHKTGTCGLGRVVDDHLKVYGVDNVRVADNSIVPTYEIGHGFAAGALQIGYHLGEIILRGD